jgi:hypothetical protein
MFSIVVLLGSPRLNDFFRVVFGELGIALALDDRMRAKPRPQGARTHDGRQSPRRRPYTGSD